MVDALEQNQTLDMTPDDMRIVANATGTKKDTVYRVAVKGDRGSKRLKAAAVAWMRIKQDAIGRLVKEVA